MMDVINPYIAGSPVKSSEMFFGREDIFTFVKETLRGQHRDNVIVLQGQRRTGKTSVLYQMQRHLEDKYICIFIDLHGLALNSIQSMLSDIENTIRRELSSSYSINIPRLQEGEYVQDPRQDFENRFLPQVWEAIGDRNILLMLDEAVRILEKVNAGKLEKDIFEYLRHLMQHFDRLNFLFSLGSGLEEMEKEYAFLFNVGMYKKISFLNRDAGEALIRKPIEDYYEIDPEAVSYILEITSGHPYFIQLICHSLFTSWQHNPKDIMLIDDVDAIIDEVVERGFAVLKYNWEESTDGEKAFLAGLTSLVSRGQTEITVAAIKQSWKTIGISIPSRELNIAAKSLTNREVITGHDDYRFNISLQCIWIEKNAHQEWVSNEIEQSIQQWWNELPVLNRIFDRLPTYQKIGLIIAFIFILGIGIFGVYRWMNPDQNGYAPDQDRMTAEMITSNTLTAVYINDQASRAIELTQQAIANENLVKLRTAEAAVTMLASTKTPETLTLTPSLSPEITLTGETIELVDGFTRTSEIDGMTLVYISAGKFIMGPSSTDRNIDIADELPQHEIYLDTFWIDQTEVSNGQYELCVAAGVCTSPSNRFSYSGRVYFGNPDYDDYPVLFVSWYDAEKYCQWAGRRLPSEAEWEKAARGATPSERIYPWGNLLPDCTRANYGGCSPHGDTEAVRSYPDGASPYDVLNMIGNAWEWVNDWYMSDYYQESPETNPLGPDHGNYKVLRGGGWLSEEANSLRVSARYFKVPGKSEWSDIGFRCAKDGLSDTGELDSPMNINPTSTSVNEIYSEVLQFAFVRFGPGSIFKAITSVDKGELLKVIGISEDGNWLTIELEDNQIGWIERNKMTDNSEFGGLATILSPPTPTLAPTPTKTPKPTKEKQPAPYP